MNQPNVSIVLVNYNGNDDTNECIISLLKIKYDNFFIIIVDNGSSEKFELNHELQGNEKIISISLDENMGFSGGNNIGIEYAINKLSAEYVVLLNNDTIVEPDFLERLIRCAKYNTNCIIGGKIRYFTNKNILWYAGGEYERRTGETIHVGFNENDNGQYDKDRRVSFVTGCLMLIPISVIQEIGMLPEEEFLYFEDTDYCCMAMNNGIEMYYCHDSVIYHKVSASSKQNSPIQNYYMVRNGLYMIKQYCVNKNFGYIKQVIRNIKRCIKGQCDFKTLIVAISDFIVGRRGKY